MNMNLAGGNKVATNILELASQKQEEDHYLKKMNSETFCEAFSKELSNQLQGFEEYAKE